VAGGATTLTNATLALPGGGEVAYAKVHAGMDSASAPLVLIHGAPNTSAGWQGVLAALPKDFPADVYVLDRLGYGDSSEGTVTSLRVHAEAVHALVAHLGRPAVLVGHSYGAPVALWLAAEHPRAVAGLVLVAGACDPQMGSARDLRRLADAMAFALPPNWAIANRELLALTGEKDALEPLLKQVRCPVTVLHGTWDPVCPHDGTVAFLERALVNAGALTVHSLERVGHNIHFSHPERIVEAATGKVEELAGDRSAR
jgi:pimeloyl-ACP methyl ester carboxylesterase